MENNKKTGYPSIDMPQKRFFRDKPLREFDVNQTVYDLINQSNFNNLHFDAIGYLGERITYKELLEKAEVLAKSFAELGVKEGDTVPILTTNTPEVAATYLALNKIGAVSKWIDLRCSEQELIHYFNVHNCKVCVCFDKIIKNVEKVINETDLKTIIVNKPADSLPKLKQVGYDIMTGLKEKESMVPKDKRFITFKEFTKLGEKSDIKVKKVSFDKERPTLIVQSSGTTGMSKSIIHTDYSVNNSFKEWSYTDLPLNPGNSLLVTVPPFVAYGLIGSYFLSLSHGMRAELCPVIDASTVYDNLGNFDLSFAAPLHYRYLEEQLKEKRDQDKIKELLKIKALITGGDKIKVEELKEIETLLRRYGCYAPVLNGYGNNEGLGAECVNPYLHNRHGSIGVALPFNKFIAVDLETGKELKYGEEGEICVQTETRFQEYTNNPEETESIKKVHADNEEWIHTKDLGYIDEDGYIYIKGRLSRVIIKAAFKISPDTIEKAICAHSAVKDCVTVGVDDEKDISVPMAFIELKDEYKGNDSVLDDIKASCERGLKSYEIPSYFVPIDEIPYTANNKQDFRKLEQMGNEMVKQKSASGKKLIKR